MEESFYSMAPRTFQRNQHSEAIPPLVSLQVESFPRTRASDGGASVAPRPAVNALARMMLSSERSRTKPKGRSPPAMKSKARKSTRTKSAGKVTRRPTRRTSKGEDLSARVDLMLFRLEQKRTALSQKSFPAYKRPSLKLLSTELSGITSPKKARPILESPLHHFEKVFAPHRAEVVPLLASPSSKPRGCPTMPVDCDDSMRRSLSTEALPQLHASSPHLMSSLNDMESMALESLCELSRANACDFAPTKVSESLLPTQLPLWV